MLDTKHATAELFAFCLAMQRSRARRRKCENVEPCQKPVVGRKKDLLKMADAWLCLVP